MFGCSKTHWPKRQRTPSGSRAGVEAVEAALTLPLLVLLTFPMLHITHNWHTQKMLKVATFEAIKVMGSPDGTIEAAERVFHEYVDAFGIRNAQLEFANNVDYDNLNTDQLFWLRGSAPLTQNRLPLPFHLSFESTIRSSEVYYRKEG